MIAQHASLKVIFVVHFVLTVFSSMSIHYLPPAYSYMNLFVLAFGAYAILYPEHVESVAMFLLLSTISVVLDVIFIAIYQPRSHAIVEVDIVAQSIKNEYRFSLGMSIVNLIIKPFTCFVLYRVHQERGGTYGDLGIPGMPNFGGHHGNYENIDRSGPNSGVETAHQSIEKSYDPPPALP
ncbi:type-1 angiotensin II receptor-associated protein-like isoform X1 [Tubulanus polymorphus]|uniref:type-1 angiotensin II receptor-associated protein-like isoform X1 n=2 Tax=Tubulanus polymorphus TaxID=672921 RepID=UPI003DA684C2